MGETVLLLDLTLRFSFAFALIFATSTLLKVVANDADPLQDYCVAQPGTLQFNGLSCKTASSVNVSDFVFSGLAQAGNTSNAAGFAVTLAFSAGQYPALNTLGIALARLDLAKGGVVPFHTHPRATEVVYLEVGTIYTGFVDTSNNLFATTIHKGDLFVYPKGLIHFQLNVGEETAVAIISFTSQNPGVQLIPAGLFGTKVPDVVLEKSFNIDQKEVEILKKKFGGS